MGSPSYRELASRANYSGTTLSEAARGLSLPSLEVTLAYVSACGGDVVFWRRYWKETDAALRAADGHGPDTSKVFDEPASVHMTTPHRIVSPRGTWTENRSSAGKRTPSHVKAVLPVLAGLFGATGVAGMVGLAGSKPKAAALTFVAGTCLASGFCLGRSLRDA